MAVRQSYQIKIVSIVTEGGSQYESYPKCLSKMVNRGIPGGPESQYSTTEILTKQKSGRPNTIPALNLLRHLGGHWRCRECFSGNICKYKYFY